MTGLCPWRQTFAKVQYSTRQYALERMAASTSHVWPLLHLLQSNSLQDLLDNANNLRLGSSSPWSNISDAHDVVARVPDTWAVSLATCHC